MTVHAYDQLAPFYRQYAQRRAAYCAAVDRQITAWLPACVERMLDVGSGDGERALQLARVIGATFVVLSDPSNAMAGLCRTHSGAEVWHCDAASLPSADTFDVITCLWNVLGAMDAPRNHAAALSAMRARLSTSGRLFIDVHNRYNIATAGALRVATRRVRDWVRPSTGNGVIDFAWRIDGRSIPSRGYLFTESELRALCASAGLRIVRHAYPDYDTGRMRGPWTGQMLLALART